MIIKVCGNTQAEQVKTMNNLGVDFLGFIFVKKSKRYISPKNAADIISKNINTSKTVGVFMNHEISNILEITKICKLDIIQLHGTENIEYVTELKSKTQLKIIKVFGIDSDFNADILYEYKDFVDYFLFDSIKKNKNEIIRGGTGQKFDWNLLKKLDSPKPWLLAGGIGLDEIDQAYGYLKQNGLAGFDLNSKVEISEGIKDLNQVEQSFNKIKALS